MTGDCKKPAGLPLLDELDGLVPSWLKEKSKDGPPPLWITLEEDGFFDKLKDAGGHALSQEARFEVSSIVGTGYVELFDRRHREDELRKRRLNAKVAELLADRIEEELQQYHFWIRHPMTELPLRLREYAQQQYPCIPEEVLEKTLFDTPGPELSSLLLSVREAQEELEAKKAKKTKKPGPHPKNYNDRIIEEVAKLYHQIGGRVAVGGGGFSKFLKVIWEALPADLRCKTAAEFVRRATNSERKDKHLPKLGSLVRGLPRDLTEKGSAKG